MSTNLPLAAATISIFTPCQSGCGTSAGSPKEITGIQMLMRNIVVFHDFVGKIEKAFMLNTANNCYIPFKLGFYKNIIETIGET